MSLELDGGKHVLAMTGGIVCERRVARRRRARARRESNPKPRPKHNPSSTNVAERGVARLMVGVGVTTLSSRMG